MSFKNKLLRRTYVKTPIATIKIKEKSILHSRNKRNNSEGQRLETPESQLYYTHKTAFDSNYNRKWEESMNNGFKKKICLVLQTV